MDFTICYKRQLSLGDVAALSDQWDVFASAYNDSVRVRSVFENVRSARKSWLVHAEYLYADHELPADGCPRFRAPTTSEAEAVLAWVDSLGDISREHLCVDITGFMRPHLLVLVAILFERGLKMFDVLYTDPGRYSGKEETPFSKGPVREVRQVAGFEGIHTSDTSNDLLIIGAGYDDELIRRVAEAKEDTRKIQLFGFPSLQAEMYQESIIRASRAAEAIGASAESDVLFAPANDPFVTAAVLQERIDSENKRKPITNLYISPLGTKAQVLGFALYYEAHLRGRAASIVFPFSERYERETTKGIARIWKYTIERLWA